MSGNTFGTIFRVSTFGESHGEALGALIDGCPAGIPLKVEDIQYELNRRRPSAVFVAADGTETVNPAVTSRAEKDEVRILSGVFDGVTTGTPIALEIKNTSARSADYQNIAHTFRPGHADYTWQKKYGIRDYRGGGRSSGRETAARVAAGAVARLILKKAAANATSTTNAAHTTSETRTATTARAAADIDIFAYTVQAAGIDCPASSLPPVKPLDKNRIEQNPLKVPDEDSAKAMFERIQALRKQGDSAGGIVECRIEGIPAGWGEPVFDKLDAELAKAVLSIGAVKGIEFGSGFAGCRMTGSEWNDPMRVHTTDKAAVAGKTEDTTDAENAGYADAVCFETNNAGGILGGISNGNTIVFRAAVKPVPSIFLPQKTVKITRTADTDGKIYENTDLVIEGRHDVCLCPRIAPVIEAMAAICLADMYLRSKSAHIH
ncbi:chorismate synthase [Treponema sp. OMZ 840]|uniref:chorismate synthase n=1 Tax=Treponema sp. OMZ 840 TaxID=244313 RepID=UPI003D9122D5